ncbi:hypothetical protein PR048_019624 [Dryococelus australis]|uniref:Uncharacterized protein n=1 Tax=Dryococelus australis TaxID=614101 RepID=A0ABQ9H3Z6_9NEOP|nr:hypothetical protein PR048_019624 [Dryococelus australis]
MPGPPATNLRVSVKPHVIQLIEQNSATHYLYSHACIAKLSNGTQQDWPACELAGRPAELREFPQANSPDDLPAGRHIQGSFAFQARTVQAEQKAELYMYGGP